MIIGKLFNEYDIDFPVEKPLVVINGKNGSGKTHVLNLVNKYFIEHGENVLYFTQDRIYDDKVCAIRDNMNASLVSNKLIDKDEGFWESVWERYDMCGEYIDYREEYYNKKIRCGYHQLLNFFGKICYSHHKELIVIIDEIEQNLHPAIQNVIISDLFGRTKVKKLIVSTMSDSIVNHYGEKNLVYPMEWFIDMKNYKRERINGYGKTFNTRT